MKRHILLLMIVIGLTGLSGNDETLSGYVRDFESNDEDQITSVYLESEDETYYFKQNAKARELIDFVDKSVTLTGYFEEEDDEIVFVIKSYRLNEE